MATKAPTSWEKITGSELTEAGLENAWVRPFKKKDLKRLRIPDLEPDLLGEDMAEVSIDSMTDLGGETRYRVTLFLARQVRFAPEGTTELWTQHNDWFTSKDQALKQAQDIMKHVNNGNYDDAIADGVTGFL